MESKGPFGQIFMCQKGGPAYNSHQQQVIVRLSAVVDNWWDNIKASYKC